MIKQVSFTSEGRRLGALMEEINCQANNWRKEMANSIKEVNHSQSQSTDADEYHYMSMTIFYEDK